MESGLTTVRFLFDGESKSVTRPCGGSSGALAPTLLAIAKDNNVPLLANCEVGACGACLVEVKASGGMQQSKSEAEEFFLHSLGRLDRSAEAGVDARLACQYRLGDEKEIEVRFSTGIGCW